MINRSAILFPGGGTQFIGMGRSALSQSAAAAKVFEEASDLLGYDVASLCLNGAFGQLSEMQRMQETIFTVSVASWHALKEETEIAPVYMAGHSLGQYSAMTCAGILSFADALNLITIRGRLLEETGKRFHGTMMAVNKISEYIVARECKKINSAGGQCYIAVFNSPLQHVVSGVRHDLELLGGALESEGAEITMLNIGTPSHCPLVEEGARAFEAEVLGAKYHYPKIPVISNVTGRPFASQEEIPDALVAHLVKPVRWKQSIAYLFNEQVTVMIDIGPQAVLKNLCHFIEPRVAGYGYDIADDAAFINDMFNRKTNGIDRLKRCLVAAAGTKNDKTADRQANEEIKEGYSRLAALRNSIEAGNGEAAMIGQGLESLLVILKAKGISNEEILLVTKEIGEVQIDDNGNCVIPDKKTNE